MKRESNGIAGVLRCCRQAAEGVRLIKYIIIYALLGELLNLLVAPKMLD